MSEWGSGMTVDRKEPPKIRTRALDPLAARITYKYVQIQIHIKTQIKYKNIARGITVSGIVAYELLAMVRNLVSINNVNP